MRELVRPFTAGAGRHSRTHCARKSSIESQATGSESRGEIVTGGAAVWGSGEIQREKKDGSGRESHGPSGDDGRIFVMYHGTSWRKWQRIRRHGFLPSGDASGLGAPLTCRKGGHGWPVGVATAQGEMGSGQGEYWPV